MHWMLLITYIKSYFIRINFSWHNFSLLYNQLISLLLWKRLTILFNSHNFFSRSQPIFLLMRLSSTYLPAFMETIYFQGYSQSYTDSCFPHLSSLIRTKILFLWGQQYSKHIFYLLVTITDF